MRLADIERRCHVVGTATRYIWRYRRSSRQFAAVLTFEAGELKKLEFEK
jgi:hypothetical protein